MIQTIPPLFLYINTSYLKSKGYKSPFFANNSYFTTYGNNGNTNKSGMILSTFFTKGNIEIWYGLHYVNCPPMVIRITINNRVIYDEQNYDHINKVYRH